MCFSPFISRPDSVSTDFGTINSESLFQIKNKRKINPAITVPAMIKAKRIIIFTLY